MTEQITPTVGMGATLCMYTDRDPYTIIKVCTPRKILVQEDICVAKPWADTMFSVGGFSGHVSNEHDQEWEITANPTGKIYELRLHKNGCWMHGKSTHFVIGKRVKFYDHNF